MESLEQVRHHKWGKRNSEREVVWDGTRASAGTPVRLHDQQGETLVLDADFTRLGRLKVPINAKRRGLVKAVVADAADRLDVTYLGPNDLNTGY